MEERAGGEEPVFLDCPSPSPSRSCLAGTGNPYPARIYWLDIYFFAEKPMKKPFRRILSYAPKIPSAALPLPVPASTSKLPLLMWSLLKEFLQFSKQEKKWWLIPLI